MILDINNEERRPIIPHDFRTPPSVRRQYDMSPEMEKAIEVMIDMANRSEAERTRVDLLSRITYMPPELTELLWTKLDLDTAQANWVVRQILNHFGSQGEQTDPNEIGDIFSNEREAVIAFAESLCTKEMLIGNADRIYRYFINSPYAERDKGKSGGIVKLPHLKPGESEVDKKIIFLIGIGIKLAKGEALKSYEQDELSEIQLSSVWQDIMGEITNLHVRRKISDEIFYAISGLWQHGDVTHLLAS